MDDAQTVIVATAMPLSASARAELSEMLGRGYTVIDIKTAPRTANIVLAPVVSALALASLRGTFSDARILFAELYDHERGINFAGPLSRIVARAPDGYFVALGLDALAPVVQSEAVRQLSGDVAPTPLSLGKVASERMNRLGEAAWSEVLQNEDMRPALAEALDLEPHPEGGWFRQTWRSPVDVTLSDGRVRPAATMIYFLLPAGESSAWHRVASDEIWLAHSGTVTLELGGSGTRPDGVRRAELGEGQAAQVLVPADTWQCTVPTDTDALVTCVVSPGFDFDDFELLEPAPSPPAP